MILMRIFGHLFRDSKLALAIWHLLQMKPVFKSDEHNFEGYIFHEQLSCNARNSNILGNNNVVVRGREWKYAVAA